MDPGSPAAEAGLQRGLVLYQIGRFEIGSVAAAEEVLQQATSGTAVDLTVGRADRRPGRVRGESYRLIAR